MGDFETKLGKDQELVVRTKKPSNRNVSLPHRVKRGIIKGRSGGDYLPRRGSPELINFYDLGQVKDEFGDWVDLPFSAAAHEWGNTLGVNGAIQLGPQVSDWTAMADMINSVDRSTWKTHYRKLEYETAEKYGIDIVADPGRMDSFTRSYPVARNGSRLYPTSFPSAAGPVSGTKWTNKGLKLAPADLPGGNGHFGQMSWGITFPWAGPDGVTGDLPYAPYATHTYDRDAEKVPFSLVGKGPTNIFVVPWLMSHVAINDVFSGSFDTWAVGATAPMSRQVFLGMTGSGISYVFFSIQPGGGLGEYIAIDATNSVSATNWIRGMPETRYFHRTGSGPGYTLDEISDPGNIWKQYYANITLATEVIVFANMNPNINSDGSGPYVPALVAVIEQKGTWYYIWWNGGPQFEFRLMDLTL